jgi:hypothetical protein
MEKRSTQMVEGAASDRGQLRNNKGDMKMQSSPESTITGPETSTSMMTDPVRETPAPAPLQAALTDPAHTAHLDETPVLEVEQIHASQATWEDHLQ